MGIYGMGWWDLGWVGFGEWVVMGRRVYNVNTVHTSDAIGFGWVGGWVSGWGSKWVDRER